MILKRRSMWSIWRILRWDSIRIYIFLSVYIAIIRLPNTISKGTKMPPIASFHTSLLDTGAERCERSLLHSRHKNNVLMRTCALYPNQSFLPIVLDAAPSREKQGLPVVASRICICVCSSEVQAEDRQAKWYWQASCFSFFNLDALIHISIRFSGCFNIWPTGFAQPSRVQTAT